MTYALISGGRVIMTGGSRDGRRTGGNAGGCK